MDEPISFRKEMAKKRLEDRIKSLREVIDKDNDREIEKAIELLEENGYIVIKNEI